VLFRSERATEIDIATLERGILLAGHHATEMLRVSEASRINADLVLAQRLLDWLHQQTEKKISLPDIYQRSLNAIGDKATAAKLVGILVDHGWLTPIPGGATIAGQHRRDAWTIVGVP
jgi:hypothetical protein